MNLIFVITKNEIRPFRSNDGKTVSVFHISGEEIFEYDEYYDFAEDLKDKLLAIINMRDFSEVAVDIAYINGEKRAAEEILREFIPCLRVQAVEFDKIDNAAEIAEKMLFITENKSVALEKELDTAKGKISEYERQIASLNDTIRAFQIENDKWETAYNALEQRWKEAELAKNKQQKLFDERMSKYRQVFRFPLKNCDCNDIEWKNIDNQIVKFDNNTNSYSGSVRLADINFPTYVSFSGASLSAKFGDISLTLSFEGRSTTNQIALKLAWARYRSAAAAMAAMVSMVDRAYLDGSMSQQNIMKAPELRAFILKDHNVQYNEPFLIITHPDDSEEAVKEWVKTKAGK